jgi:hypothetical protein
MQQAQGHQPAPQPQLRDKLVIRYVIIKTLVFCAYILTVCMTT